MRDPARIPDVLTALQEVWTRNPDWRLIQVIRNAAPASSGEMSSRLYSVEDDVILAGLHALLADGPQP